MIETEYESVKEFTERNKECISPWLIGEGIRRGQIPHIRIGRRILVPRDALSRMEAQQARERAERCGCANREQIG